MRISLSMFTPKAFSIITHIVRRAIKVGERLLDRFAPLATIRIYDDGPQNNLPIATNRRCVHSISDFAPAPSILRIGLNRTPEIKILAPRLNFVVF
jgi:hypothetical protein